MAAIFGVEENIWCEALTDALKKLETKQKERDKDAKPRSIMSPPAAVVTVSHTFDQLGIDGWLDGEPVERINLRIGIS